MPRVIGGRYGLSSKEFTRAWSPGCWTSWKERPKNRSPSASNDDVSHTSLELGPRFHPRRHGTSRVACSTAWVRTAPWGQQELDQDHRRADRAARAGLFPVRLEKAGAVTVSHLRLVPGRSARPTSSATVRPVRGLPPAQLPDPLRHAGQGGTGRTFLLNSPVAPDAVWDSLPRSMQRQMIDKGLKFHVIDAYGIAQRTGMGRRINTIMQACFLRSPGDRPDLAMREIKTMVEKTYGRKAGACSCATLPRSTRPWAGCTRSPCRRSSAATSRCRRWWPPMRPSSYAK